jgi:hypothetical protein
MAQERVDVNDRIDTTMQRPLWSRLAYRHTFPQLLSALLCSFSFPFAGVKPRETGASWTGTFCSRRPLRLEIRMLS